MAGYKNLPDLVEKLKQTFHGGAAEDVAKQQPGSTVGAALPEAVAPAAQSLRSDARMPGTRDEAPDADLEELMRDDPLCAGEQLTGDLHAWLHSSPCCMHIFSAGDSDRALMMTRRMLEELMRDGPLHAGEMSPIAGSVQEVVRFAWAMQT